MPSTLPAVANCAVMTAFNEPLVTREYALPESLEPGEMLIEVLAALGILAVGLMGVLTLLVTSLRDGTRGRHTSAAAMIGIDQLELIQRMPFSSVDLNPVAWTTAPWLANAGDPSLNPGEVTVRVARAGGSVVEQIYTVSYRVIADPGGDTDLRSVDVEVTWTEEGFGNFQRTRTGLPTAALSTLLVNNDR